MYHVGLRRSPSVTLRLHLSYYYSRYFRVYSTYHWWWWWCRDSTAGKSPHSFHSSTALTAPCCIACAAVSFRFVRSEQQNQSPITTRSPSFVFTTSGSRSRAGLKLWFRFIQCPQSTHPTHPIASNPSIDTTAPHRTRPKIARPVADAVVPQAHAWEGGSRRSLM